MDVPVSFQAFMPSSSVKLLDANRDKNYIIESLLKNADLAAWKWMTKVYPSKDIIGVVKSSKRLTPRDVNFWQIRFNIPRDEIKCLQKDSLKTQKSFWPY